MMAIRAGAKGLFLDVEYNYPLPKTVRTDPSRLRQILVNLIGNAVKFTDRGGVRVLVQCDRINGSQPVLSMTVNDTGIGIAEEHLKGLFQPFTQGDMSTTRRFGGTGLGLAISQRLAQMLGGQIEVESQVGKGSTFRLTIDPGPLQGSVLAGDLPASDRIEVPPSSLVNLRTAGSVLLAEDSLDIQVLIAGMLRRMGIAVDAASDGREAFEKAIAARDCGRPYDLILMDMQMPEWDGYEATRSLRKAGVTERIVALTAHAMTGDRQKCLNAGCDDYLAKPVKTTELARAVSGFLLKPAAEPSYPAEPSAPGSNTGCGVLSSKYFTDADRHKLLRGFVDGLSERIEKIQSALEAHNIDSLIQTAHALHGAAALYGYEKLAKTAQTVEVRARNGATLTEVEAAARGLLQLCDTTRREFQMT
jgi:CheY-like chemotaxis protein